MGITTTPGQRRRRVVTTAVAATVVLTTGLGGTALLAPSAAAQPVMAAPLAAADEPPVRDDRTVIDVGHVDAISPRMAGGTFQSLLLDDRDALNPVWRTPESVILHLTPAGAVPLSEDDPGFLFLGAPGDTVYVIPQTQNPDLIWAGWSTQSFTSADLRGDMRLSLDIVEGPGDVVLWEWSPFGEPEMIIDGRNGLPATYTVAPGTHQHANWGFTKPGVYRLTFRWSAELADGTEVEDASRYTFAVGDVDTSAIELPSEGSSPSPSPTTTSPTPTPSETAPPSPSPSDATTPPGSTEPTTSAEPTASSSPSPSAPPSAEPSASGAPEPMGTGAPVGDAATGGGTGSSPKGGATGQLAHTGSSWEPVGATALGALVLGSAGVLVARSRKREHRS
ncbi:choice-of-anchor M domain-containing protein [Streptomyces sp. NPDC047046]|uniref:choice-of-anchor M domain-containing protein n=1 Tax=Streptomyces sp. NPDC047046 TaxID=3155378 RepID=UPI0033DC80F9